MTNHSGFLLRLIAPVIVACAAIVSPAYSAEVEPLRSADLEARLVEAGFDDAQRNKILSEYDAYVSRFKQVAENQIVEWRASSAAAPKTLEDAQALQRSGRAAAQAIDDSERPLLDAIRAAAKPEQSKTVERLIGELEIRRDLAFAAVLREGFFVQSGVDLLAAIKSAQLQEATMTALRPQLDQYLLERQAAVRKLRDATINLPTRRVEARARHSMPAMPQQTAEASVTSEQFMEYFRAEQAAREALRADENAERRAGKTRLVELDARTIESIIPILRGRDQARLLAAWWSGAGVIGGGKSGAGFSAPSALRRAWSVKEENLAAGAATNLDAICAAWVSQWWPCAKEAAINAAASGGGVHFQFLDESEPEMARCAERVEAETTRTVEAIRFAFDGPAVAAADGPAGSAQGAAQPQVAFGGPAAVTTFTVSGEDGEDITLDISNLEGIEVGGGLIEFDGALMEGVSFEISGAGVQMGGGSGTLPALVRFEEIEPVLKAAQVEPEMLPVAQSVLADLATEAQEITSEAAALDQGADDPFNLYFEKTSDGEVKPADPAKRTALLRNREELRTRLLELETTALRDLFSTIVPAEGQQTCAWLIHWRQLASARAGVGRNGPLGLSGSTSLDLIPAVFAAKFDGSDWKAAGPSLTELCADLASRTAAAKAAQNAAQGAMPGIAMAQMEGAEVERQQAVAQAAVQDFIKLESRARELAKSLLQTSDASVVSLKARVSPDCAVRLQDACDDQRYSRDLRDPTALGSRFEGMLALELPDAVRKQVEAMQSKWGIDSRAIRTRIVDIRNKSSASPLEQKSPEAARETLAARKVQAAELAAVKFERDELNRKVFRELASLVGEANAARLQPLPGATKGRAAGVQVGGASLSVIGGGATVQPAAPAAAPPPPPKN